MARTLFFVWSLGSSQKLLTTNSIFISCNIFYNHEYFFFQSAFWSLFNHRQRSQSKQKQCSLCCGSPCFRVLLCTHYGLLQCFLTCFRKLKQIGVLRPIFPDYVFSCNYDQTYQNFLKISWINRSLHTLKIFFPNNKLVSTKVSMHNIIF